MLPYFNFLFLPIELITLLPMISLKKNSQTAQNEYSVRWVIESMHCEIKQLTGIEKCQCRKQRIQRNHIACSLLVWAFLKRIARKTKETVYKVKNILLDNYMKA